MEAGKGFEARAAVVLQLGRDGISFAHNIDADELQALVEAAEQLCLRVRAAWRLFRDGPAAAMPDLARSAAQRPHRSACATCRASAPCPACDAQLESLPILQAMLVQFRGWEAHARAITQTPQGAPLRPSFAVLKTASAQARGWPITSRLRAGIDEAVSKTGARGRARSVGAVRGRGSQV